MPERAAPPAPRDVRRGIVLVVVSGITVLLVLVAIALIQAGRLGASTSTARLNACHARLASASGMEYASARLQDHPWPRSTPGSAGRGDDWTYRESPASTPPFLAHNPSYGRGEPWLDASTRSDGVDNNRDPNRIRDEPGEADRIFIPGEDPAWIDLDGDGAHTAWSGRLRGGRGPTDLLFSLKVESPEAKLPLNAGNLNGFIHGPDGIDNDQDGNVDENGSQDPNAPFTPDEFDMDGRVYDGRDRGNGVPDHRDVWIPYHASLVQILNNLGAILRPLPGPWAQRWALPSGGPEPIEVSWLGYDLIRNRPVGGYRSWEEVERTLMNLPAPLTCYTQAELDLFRPFIDLGPYEPLQGGSRCRPDQAFTAPAYVPVNLWTASPEALQSIWRYLSYRSPYGEPTDEFWFPPGSPSRGLVTGRIDDFLGETAGWALTCPHSGLRFGGDPADPRRWVRLILWPDEARELAEETIRFREDGAVSWNGFRSRLATRAGAIFRDDFNALSPAGLIARSWVVAKSSLAFQAATTDPYPPRGGGNSCLSCWGSWGIDVDGDSSNGVQPPASIDLDSISRLPFPQTWTAPPLPGDSLAAAVEARDDGGSEDLEKWTIGPQGLAIAPPALFSVASHGACGEGAALLLEGTLRAGCRVDFTTQEDFEALRELELHRPGFLLDKGTAPLTVRERETRLAFLTMMPGLARLGIEAVADRPPSERRNATLNEAPCVASLPRWNWRGITVSDASCLNPPLLGFSSVYGALCLNRIRAPAVGGSQLIWPLLEDFDGVSGPAGRDLFAAKGAYSPNPAGSWASDPYPMAIPTPEGSGPLALSGTLGSLQCPGFDRLQHGSLPGQDPSPKPIVLASQCPTVLQFTWDAWLGPESEIRINGSSDEQISVTTRRGWKTDPSNVGTFVRLRVCWITGMWYKPPYVPQDFDGDGVPDNSAPPWGKFQTQGAPLDTADSSKFPSLEWFYPDSAGGPVVTRHLCLTMRRSTGTGSGAGTTGKGWVNADGTVIEPWWSDFYLYVDGVQAGGPGPTLRFWDPTNPDIAKRNGGLWCNNQESLLVRGVDQLRFCKDYKPGGVGVPSTRRFTPQGTYISPLYRLEEGCRLGQVQWTGIVPPQLAPPPGREPIAVSVRGYDVAGVQVGAFTLPGGSGAVNDLSRLGMPPNIRSFRYEVFFDCSYVSGNLLDSPVFESIWISLQRGGRRWASWR